MLPYRFQWLARYPALAVVFLVASSLMEPKTLGSDDAARERQASVLIQQLTDKEFKVRQAAAKAIEELGPEALPALRKARNTPDPDVRRRIEKWIPEFEMAAFVAPKLIDLNVANQPLKKVIEELAWQTGYNLNLQSARTGEKCSYSFRQVPFWKALDDICKDQKLAISRQAAGPISLLYLSSSDRANDHVAHDRAFRIAAEHLEYRKETSEVRTAQLGVQPAVRRSSKDGLRVTEHLIFHFTLAAEPRLRILSVAEPDIADAVTEQGRSLILKSPHRKMAAETSGRGPGPFPCAVQLAPPIKGERVLKLLRGNLPIRLEKEERTIVVFDDLSKAQGKSVKVDQETVQVDFFDSRPMASTHRIALTVVGNKGAGDSADSEPEGYFELQDAKGNSYEPCGMSLGWDGNKREYECRFFNAPALVPPQKLVYKKKISLVYHIPFEFKDLPLP